MEDMDITGVCRSLCQNAQVEAKSRVAGYFQRSPRFLGAGSASFSIARVRLDISQRSYVPSIASFAVPRIVYTSRGDSCRTSCCGLAGISSRCGLQGNG